MNSATNRKAKSPLKLLSGFAFPSSGFCGLDQGIPLVRIRDIKTGSTEVNFKGQFDRAYLLVDGDVIVGMDGDFNVVRWNGGPALLNQRVCKIVAGEGTLDQQFLYHFLQPQLDLIHRRTPQTTVRHLSTGALYGIEFPEIPLSEQQQIADILNTLDSQIGNIERIIAKLKLAKHGLASDLLPLDGDSQVEVRPLRALADISGGVTLGSEPSGPGTIRRPYLRVANVQDGHLDLSEIKFLRIRSSDLARYSLKHGDVLMNEGGDADKLGRGTVWENQIEGCLHQNHVFRVRADRRVLEPWFLAHISGSAYGKKYFLAASKQTTNLATINSTQIGAFPIPLPSVEEQLRIVEILSSHDALVAREESTLKKLYRLKTGLMSDLLTGRVRTPLEAMS